MAAAALLLLLSGAAPVAVPFISMIVVMWVLLLLPLAMRCYSL